MNIAVCIKQTFDSEARIHLSREGLIDESLVKFIINPFDEYAIEEALRLKEVSGGQVVLASADRKDPSIALRHGLAMGADRAVWVDCSDVVFADHHIYAQALGRWLKSQDLDMVLCGKMAIDDGASELPSRLATVLAIAQVNTVSSLKMEGRKLHARRDIEGGYEIIEVSLPCLVSTQKGLNTPRYPSMRRIMEARKKIETIRIGDLGLSSVGTTSFITIEEYLIPPPRVAGRILEGDHGAVVRDLLRILKEERKVI